jgi:hypothetical protein
MYMYSQINTGNTCNTPQGDCGAYPADAFNLVQNQGSDFASDYPQTILANARNPAYSYLWPYYPFYDWKDKPTAAQQANAAYYKLGQWHTLLQYPLGNAGADGVTAIEAALSSGQPVAIEFQVRPGFESLTAASDIDNDTSGQILGYHEVLAVGYNQNGLYIQNSWGAGWGYGGFGYLSWAVVQKDVLEADVIDQAFSTAYTVTASAGTGGNINPAGAIAVAAGTSKTFTLTPNTGYKVSSVGGTCGGTLNGNSYTTNAVKANCTVAATFTPVTYTITASAGANR